MNNWLECTFENWNSVPRHTYAINFKWRRRTAGLLILFIFFRNKRPGMSIVSILELYNIDTIAVDEIPRGQTNDFSIYNTRAEKYRA